MDDIPKMKPIRKRRRALIHGSPVISPMAKVSHTSASCPAESPARRNIFPDTAAEDDIHMSDQDTVSSDEDCGVELPPLVETVDDNIEDVSDVAPVSTLALADQTVDDDIEESDFPYHRGNPIFERHRKKTYIPMKKLEISYWNYLRGKSATKCPHV